jgi:tripartite ATP-independent transporter DctP family solute receptor
MKKIFGILVLVLAIPCFLFAGGGQAAPSGGGDPKVTITLGTAYPPTSPLSIAVFAAQKEIAEKSNGSITLEYYHSSQIGDNAELAEGLAAGSVDMNVQSLSFFTARLPEVELDSAFFVYRDEAHVDKVWAGEIGGLFRQKLLETYKIRIVDTWLYGTRVMTTGNKPIYKPADMTGLKMRVPDNPMWLDMMRAFGANPTPVAFAELYLALSQNMVDGQENPVPTIISSKFDEVQNYMSLTNHKFETHYPMINEKKWQSLTPNQRSIVETAFKNARIINNNEINKQTVEGIAAFKAAGKTVIENPDREAFLDAYLKMLNTPRYVHIIDMFKKIQEIR